MTPARIRAEFHKLTVRAVRPGLSRTRFLLASLGHPDRCCPAVQITGTNGKGSVTALLESALRAQGFSTGLFTSPHLKHERERICIDGRPLSPQAFTAAARKLLPALRTLFRNDNPATSFEAWTALAAQAFRAAKTDIALLEVGMGGRLDATSAWQRMVLSVLTQVSLDHTRELGNTLPAILREKMAIGRKGVWFLSSETEPQLKRLLLARGRDKGFQMAFAGPGRDCQCRLLGWRRNPSGVRIDLRLPDGFMRGLQIGLAGAHQAWNGALAVLALYTLRKSGFEVSASALRKGFRTVVWPGRMERISHHPEIILDGAHNPAAARAVAAEIKATRGRVYVIAGMMADKDVAGMVQALAPVARKVWTVTPPDQRGLPAAELSEKFRARGVLSEPRASMASAAARACQAAGKRGSLWVVGSLYNIEPARRAIRRLLPKTSLINRPGYQEKQGFSRSFSKARGQIFV